MSNRKTQISRAALAVFARYGLKRTSMADVAEEAGLSRPAIYQYFRGKDDLVAACFDLVTEDGFALAQKAADATQGRTAKVTAYLTTYMRFFYQMIYAGPHSEDVLALKTRFGPDKVTAARTRLVARLNALAGLAPEDETGILLAHAGEGLKIQAENEQVLETRLQQLVRAVLATETG